MRHFVNFYRIWCQKISTYWKVLEFRYLFFLYDVFVISKLRDFGENFKQFGAKKISKSYCKYGDPSYRKPLADQSSMLV